MSTTTTTDLLLDAALGSLGADELRRRADDARRLLRANGVTYRSADAAPDRPGGEWALDPIPSVVSSEDWSVIEEGIVQRAELLDLVLRDLYGPAELVTHGILPPEVVYGHPGFLHAAYDAGLPGASQLITYAADIVRSAQGPMVLSDRAQAPSGAGYALENRVVVSRVLPSLYRGVQVHRLAPYFRALRAALSAAAPAHVDEPRVVILTPGPWSETYFEHASLAAHLGCALVAGSDLTVRNGHVYLRALGGLERVDVILRRVDASYCDPLELRPDSQLGTPGLLEAARLGNVAIVNPPGAGVLENAALVHFLPRVCEHLLGESLRLPSVPSWWCGDEAERSHVLADLDRFVLRPIARGPGSQTRFADQLSRAERDVWRARIEARPWAFVAQERAEPERLPTLGPSGIEARPAVLRAFAVARSDSYAVMPGGLTRVAPSSAEVRVANQSGAVAKDTWVLASEPEPTTELWFHSGPTVRAEDAAGILPAHTAENLFWVGRYAERAEQTVRMLRVALDRRADFASSALPAGHECLQVVLDALSRVTGTLPGFTAGVDDVGEELRAVATDRERPGSLAFSLERLVSAANAARDHLSPDTWLALGDIGRGLDELELASAGGRTAASAVLAEVMRRLLALSGLAAESLVRDSGWHFLEAGRRIERALALVDLLEATMVDARDAATDSLVLESVLTAAESVLTYRRRYRSQAQHETVLDLLLLDEDNPRALAHQVGRLVDTVGVLPHGHAHPTRLPADEKQALELRTVVRTADTARLARAGRSGREALAGLLDDLRTRLERLALAIDGEHFPRLASQQAFAAPTFGPEPSER